MKLPVVRVIATGGVAVLRSALLGLTGVGSCREMESPVKLIEVLANLPGIVPEA